MSGLVKQKNYDWKDSNLALFGSDTEKEVKKASADTEPAWDGAGTSVGLQIWRIVKFEVKHWDKDSHGSFFSGDSYIILNTYKEKDSEELNYDLHFWIGQHSTQDEYGTAAYKTVELDTKLDDKPIQHREVQGQESRLFKSYFKSITLMKGGADSGFKHVEPEKYESRLMQFTHKNKCVTVKEVGFSQKSLDSGDVFILDAGLKYYQWNGKSSNHFERHRAAEYLTMFREKRPKAERILVDDGEKSKDMTDFYDLLPLENPEEEDDDVQNQDENDDSFIPCLYKLSNASGKLEFTCVCETPDLPIPYSKLQSDDVFIADSGKAIYVWVGNGASAAEKKNAMAYAHNYLQKTGHPFIPVTILKENSAKSHQEFRAVVS